MSVLIKGMEMPEGCPFCPLSHWTRGTDEFAGCNIVPGKRYAMLNDIAFAVSLAKSRPDWCPLIEVQPHGRLIDADALCEKLETAAKIKPWLEGAFNAAIAFALVAPTIIPAEPAEEGET